MIIQITQVQTPPAPFFAGALTATGTTQATAYPLAARVNVLTVVPAGAGVALMAGAAEQKVLNYGTAPVLVYPPVGQAINGGALNAPATVAANGGSATFDFDGVADWWSS